MKDSKPHVERHAWGPTLGTSWLAHGGVACWNCSPPLVGDWPVCLPLSLIWSSEGSSNAARAAHFAFWASHSVLQRRAQVWARCSNRSVLPCGARDQHPVTPCSSSRAGGRSTTTTTRQVNFFHAIFFCFAAHCCLFFFFCAGAATHRPPTPNGTGSTRETGGYLKKTTRGSREFSAARATLNARPSDYFFRLYQVKSFSSWSN